MKAHFLVMDLPYCDAYFVKAYPGETTEAFCDAHNCAFAFFGGVPREVLYDNTKIAVARILGNGKRKLTRIFSELLSHYLFDTRFGRPGKGNDKGKVEGLVGYVRRNPLSADTLLRELRCPERLPGRAVQKTPGRSAEGTDRDGGGDAGP